MHLLVCLLGQQLLACGPCSEKHLCTVLTTWLEAHDVAWHKKTSWANPILSLRNMILKIWRDWSSLVWIQVLLWSSNWGMQTPGSTWRLSKHYTWAQSFKGKFQEDQFQILNFHRHSSLELTGARGTKHPFISALSQGPSSFTKERQTSYPYHPNLTWVYCPRD